MVEVTAKANFKVDPDTIWNVIGDPGAISSWHPGVAESALEGTGPGATRRCTLANGAKLVEKIEAQDEGSHSYTYTITGSPLPVENYRATIAVRAADGGSQVEWSGRFDTPAEDPAELESMIKDIYESGLQALKQSLGG